MPGTLKITILISSINTKNQINNNNNNKCKIIINTHGRFAIAFLPLTTRLSTELFEAVFIKKSSG